MNFKDPPVSVPPMLWLPLLPTPLSVGVMACVVILDFDMGAGDPNSVLMPILSTVSSSQLLVPHGQFSIKSGKGEPRETCIHHLKWKSHPIIVALCPPYELGSSFAGP